MTTTSEVMFAPRPFAPLQRNEVVWRGTKPQAACATAQIACDTVSASKSKCGFAEFGTPSSPPKRYVTATLVQTCANTHTGASGSFTCYINQAGLFSCPTTLSGEGDSCAGDIIFNCNGSGPNELCDDLCNDCGDFDCSYASTTQQLCVATVCFGGDGLPGKSYSQTTTLSNEYDSATLKSNVIAALPAFDGVYDDTCSATYNLSNDETSFTLSRCKYVINFNQPLCLGAVVHWIERFTPSIGGSSTDVQRSYAASGGETQIGPFTIPDPTDNGTTTPMNATVDCSQC